MNRCATINQYFIETRSRISKSSEGEQWLYDQIKLNYLERDYRFNYQIIWINLEVFASYLIRCALRITDPLRESDPTRKS